MEREKKPSTPRVQGSGFETAETISTEFPGLNVEAVRQSIAFLLAQVSKSGYTGIEEEIEFDKHGLPEGTYRLDSIMNILDLRTKNDIERFVQSVGDGENFDVYFVFNPETKRARLGCTLKKHALVPNLYTFESRIKEK